MNILQTETGITITLERDEKIPCTATSGHSAWAEIEIELPVPNSKRGRRFLVRVEHKKGWDR